MPARPPRQSKSRKADLTMGAARQFLKSVATHADEYAGIPMPIEGQHLVVHPSYRFAGILNDARKKAADPDDSPRRDERVRNGWKSRRGWDVVIVENTTTGRVWGGRMPCKNRAQLQLSTMGVAGAWDIKAETIALEKLRGLIKPHLFEMYLLTGMFLETSPRSGLTYIFRRLRPTLAVTTGKSDMAEVLCGLCLHPIGFYDGSWGGCMVPTDEVVAHLILMRGDEADFWRQASQHPAWHPASGL